MRSSQLCLVSSIAAHSSPLGWAAAPVNTSSGMRTSSFPMPLSPSASASRRAGSTVSTSTRPPSSTTAVAASAAAVVVLPTPPGPHAMTMSLAASSWPTVLTTGGPVALTARAPRRARAPPGVSCAPRSCAAKRYGNNKTGMPSGNPACNRCRWVERVRRSVTASRAASSTGATEPPARSERISSVPGSRSCSKISSSRWPKSSGNTRLTTTADMRTVVSARTRSTSSSVSFTGISSGVHTATSPVWRGSERMSSIQSVWLRIRPTLTRSLMAWGAASSPMMCPLAGASTTTRS